MPNRSKVAVTHEREEIDLENTALMRYTADMFLRLLGKVVIWFEVAVFTFALICIGAYIAFGMR